MGKKLQTLLKKKLGMIDGKRKKRLEYEKFLYLPQVRSIILVVMK